MAMAAQCICYICRYREPAHEWAKLFKPGGADSVRYTALDGVFLCLLVEQAHLQYAVDAGCDGLYVL